MKSTGFAKTMVGVCVALAFFACSHNEHHLEEASKQEIPVAPNAETFVSLKQATDVAGVFFSRQRGETNLRSATSQKAVASTEMVKDGDNPLMYVINYAGGGFVIVSATKNYYPVLAYSDDNSFELAPDMGAVSVWMNETEEAIRTSAALDDTIKQEMRAQWKSYEMADFKASSKSTLRSASTPYDAMMERMNELYYQYGPDGWYRFYSLYYAQGYLTTSIWNSVCDIANSVSSPLEYTIVAIKAHPNNGNAGPLLTTQWHQDTPFNELCPNKYPAGCVAIAMAQIMKFHRWPTNYNWSDMPNTGATTSTQTLIRDIGTAVKMNYGSTNSGASIDDANSAFRNSYSYNVTQSDHNATQVKNEILINKRPVYMRGGNANSGDGHAWVCDGALESTSSYYYFVEYQFGGDGSYSYNNLGYTSATYPGFAGSYNSLYFYMKWGQLYGDKDGWFIGDNINLGDRNYQSGRVNIFVSPK